MARNILQEANSRWFYDELNTMDNYSVLEIGTLRWEKDKPTHHKDIFPKANEYIMTDVQAGIDVDIVSDIHSLSDVFGENRFDVIFIPSVFEHLRKPWIAAKEVLKTLKPKGLFFVQTHQTFPLHGYPHDYYRYTKEGLEILFEDASEKHAFHEFPCQIVPPEVIVIWSKSAPAFLNSAITGKK